MLLHILQHVEDMDSRLAEIETDIATFRPLLDKWRNSPLGKMSGAAADGRPRRGGWQATATR